MGVGGGDMWVNTTSNYGDCASNDLVNSVTFGQSQKSSKKAE